MTSTYKSAVVQRSVEFYREWLGFNLTGEAENDGKMFWCCMGGEPRHIHSGQGHTKCADCPPKLGGQRDCKAITRGVVPKQYHRVLLWNHPGASRHPS